MNFDVQNIINFVQTNGATWLAAAVIMVIGYIIAMCVRWGVASAINRTGFGAKAKASGGNIGRSLGQAFFWVIILFALYQALSKLGMGETLAPLNELLNKISAFAPKLFGATLTFIIGFIVANVAKLATSSTLEAAQIDGLAAKSGLTSSAGSSGGLAKAIGTFVFVIIIVPVAIAALGLLEIKSISEPLTLMLTQFTDFIPKIIGASIVLAAAIFIGKWASGIFQTMLPSFGFDNAVNQIGLLDDGKEATTPPSAIAGKLVFVIALVIGLTAAVDILQIEALSDVFGTVQDLGGRILLAGATIAVGVFLANFVSRIVSAASGELAGRVIKYATIVLATFMGLLQLGIGEEIVQTAFQYGLGAAAVAAALAFGLGGRDWAKAKLQKWSPPK